MRHLALLIGAALVAASCSSNPAPPSMAERAGLSAQDAVRSQDITALSDITRMLIDASALYTAAADDSNNAAFSGQLRTLAGARTTMTNSFQARVTAMGGAAPDSGQALGSAHRAFMEARTLGNEDTKVAVQEALRGENHLLEQMTEASNNVALNAETRGFIGAQLAHVIADRDVLQAYAASLG
jgi:uncharacterized protein (TIGR02284 family)